jgi:hypothetical protein
MVCMDAKDRKIERLERLVAEQAAMSFFNQLPTLKNALVFAMHPVSALLWANDRTIERLTAVALLIFPGPGRGNKQPRDQTS